MAEADTTPRYTRQPRNNDHVKFTIYRLQSASVYTFEVRLNGESGVVAKSIDEPREPPDAKLSSFNILIRDSFD